MEDKVEKEENGRNRYCASTTGYSAEENGFYAE